MSVKYIIVLKSQLGPKPGTLKIRGTRERLWGVLELLGHKNILIGNMKNEGKAFDFKGKIRTPLGLSVCLLTGIKGENKFIGELRIDNKSYDISGEKIESV